jgi:hypothetical protein
LRAGTNRLSRASWAEQGHGGLRVGRGEGERVGRAGLCGLGERAQRAGLAAGEQAWRPGRGRAPPCARAGQVGGGGKRVGRAGEVGRKEGRWPSGPRARWAAGRRLGARSVGRPGKSRVGPGGKGGGGRRGQLGRGSWAAGKEGGLREFSFYLFLFLSFSLFENMF